MIIIYVILAWILYFFATLSACFLEKSTESVFSVGVNLVASIFFVLLAILEKMPPKESKRQ